MNDPTLPRQPPNSGKLYHRYTAKRLYHRYTAKRTASLEGAYQGAIAGDAPGGALIGAAVGGVVGVVLGAYQPIQEQEQSVRDCLSEMGYVVGS